MVEKAKKFNLGTGRRKTSVARVRMVLGKGQITVNDRPVEDYFKRKVLTLIVKQPLEITDMAGKLDIFANIAGGGLSGQAGALRHGISRALIEFDKALRPILKKAGYLTRDPRMVERKKYGLHGARKATQFSKR